ncbi:MAG: hypothetical protein IPG16_10800 [Comamonadaceae bacterium]|jgi:hypothetical protein|nr:hypothetical protein [Comamonadaceae bacterium]
MTDAFTQKALKRQRAPKLKRDPVSGVFEGATALNDPVHRAQAVRWARAIKELEPLLAGMADDQASPEVRQVMQFTGVVLQTLGRTMLDALSVHTDDSFVAELYKPVLKAPRRGGRS